MAQIVRKSRRRAHALPGTVDRISLQTSKKAPQNLKLSIYWKYRRRLRQLRSAIEGFQIAARDRLRKGGDIKNRANTVAILQAVNKTAKLLPRETEFQLMPEMLDRLFGPNGGAPKASRRTNRGR